MYELWNIQLNTNKSGNLQLLKRVFSQNELVLIKLILSKVIKPAFLTPEMKPAGMFQDVLIKGYETALTTSEMKPAALT